MLEKSGPGGQLPRDEEAAVCVVRDQIVSLTPPARFNTSRSELSSSGDKHGMYAPLSDALNYGLERLSEIDVDGLPEFKDHIVFVPSDKDVTTDRDLEGSLFEPEVALMRFATACDLLKIKVTRSLSVSRFVSKIPKTTPERHHQADPTYRIGWKEILSPVEVKQYSSRKWPILETFVIGTASITKKDADEELATSRNPDPETSSDISESRTRKIHTLVHGRVTEN